MIIYLELIIPPVTYLFQFKILVKKLKNIYISLLEYVKLHG